MMGVLYQLLPLGRLKSSFDGGNSSGRLQEKMGQSSNEVSTLMSDSKGTGYANDGVIILRCTY